MVKPLQYIGQGIVYAIFFGTIGYFSTLPKYEHIPADETLIKVSFRHAGQLVGKCRELTPEEIAALPPYKRKGAKKGDCPRERSNVEVELELDGKKLYHETLVPTGLAHSSNANIYRRIPVKAGVHTLKARLKDHPDGDYNYVTEETVDLAPGRVLVIDFKAATGGFVFKNKNTNAKQG